jgi:hypothetical protein
MPVLPFKRFQAPDRELMLLQDNAGNVLDGIKKGSAVRQANYDGNGNLIGFNVSQATANILDGVLFRGILFRPSTNVSLPHGLGRYADYILVSTNAAFIILRSPNDAVSANRSSADQNQNIILITSGTCMVDIWCF